MPVPVQFTEKDLLRGKVVIPAWYVVKIDAVHPFTPSKDGGSQNANVEGTIIRAEDGSGEFAGVPLEWNFNSKAIGFAVGFLAAFGVEIKAGSRFDLAATENRELLVFVENDTWQGRTVNRVNHKYKALAAA